MGADEHEFDPDENDECRECGGSRPVDPRGFMDAWADALGHPLPKGGL